MMRYQRVSPDCLGLPNGRKPSIRPFNDSESDPFRVRSGSGSIVGSAIQAQIQDDYDSLLPDSLKSQNHHPSGGGDVLLQWGHKKRLRGSRAENRMVADEPSVHSRSHIKIQRRAAIAGAEKIAAAAAAWAMPPPCGGGSHSRGANLRGCMPLSDNNRTVEERSNCQHRPDKRSPPSPPPHKTQHPNKAASASATDGFGLEASTSMNPDSNRPSDQETAASGSGGGLTMEKEKVNLEQFEWPRIYISLSRKEKEDDFLAMKGTKLPQRPKKRAKNVDKSLQYCFPGMWLSDLTRGRYEVREKKCTKKKRRGLKGMESVDSDSE